MNIEKSNVLFCRKRVIEYLEKAKEYEEKAKNCQPKQRGAYRSHAVQHRKNASRMKANLAAQMEWLFKNNLKLYQELKSENWKINQVP